MEDRFRALLQRFIRELGVLSPDRTPCGKALAPSEAHALMVLRAAGDGLRQGELAARLGLDKSSASRLVARLRDRGHLGDARGDGDGRARPVRLTARGERLAAELDGASRDLFAALLGGIPAGRRRDVIAALDELVGSLERLTLRRPEDEP